MHWNEDAERVMAERFGKDTVIPLATVEDGIPYVRNVNAYYEDGSFYVITHALSNKMRHIRENPTVAITGDWFTGHARGTNLGWFCAEKNRPIAEKLRTAFASWIDNGHNDFADENTIILRLDLRDAVLLSQGTRYERTKDDLRKMDEERIQAEAQKASMASAVLLHRRMVLDLHDLDVSADAEYQINFRSFFQMRRGYSDAFAKRFFEILEEVKFCDHLTFPMALERIWQIRHTYEMSLASVMLHVVCPEHLIWDNEISKRYFGMSVPTAKKDRERAFCMRYEEYEAKFNELVASDEGKRIIRFFDDQLPNMRSSDAEKVYFMMRLNRV